MVIKSTPHAHTTFVDGANSPEEMVRAAIARGFASLGLSEHGRQVFDIRYGMTVDSEAAYMAEVKRLQSAYEGQIALHLGVERDSYGVCDPAQFAYTIGSKHYMKDGEAYFAVDGALDTVGGGLDQMFGGDWYRLADRYFSELADFIVEARPDIIGHFDLLTKFNEDGHLFDMGDARFLGSGREALARMADTGALLEVNTGAMARGYRVTPYPSLPFLTFWRERGGRVIYSSDCHDKDKLDYGMDAAYELMRAAGYRSAWALGTADELFVEYQI